MLSGTSSFPRKRTGHNLTAIPASYKHVPNGHTRLENVKIKEKAEPETPIASRFSLGSVDKKDTRLKYGVKRQNKKPCLEGTVKTDIFKSEHPTRKPLY